MYILTMVKVHTGDNKYHNWVISYPRIMIHRFLADICSAYSICIHSRSVTFVVSLDRLYVVDGDAEVKRISHSM